MSKIAGVGNTANDDAPRNDAKRAAWISELARAPEERVATLWEAYAASAGAPTYERLRGPEIGLVMTRGRAGAVGDAFNLGEATATRCSVRLESGEEGHSYALGRGKRKAEISAVADALMQTAAAEALDAALLEPLRRERMAREATAARKAAATRVEFFTVARGED